MKAWCSVWRQTASVILVAASALVALGAPLQLVSTTDPHYVFPAGGNVDSGAPVLTADGRYVLFTSAANDLLLTGSPSPLRALFPTRLNVFLRDRANGTTTLVSINRSGTGGGNGDSIGCEISNNGRYALFESTASDLVAGDTNNASDVFVRDLVTGTTLLVSASTNDQPANGISVNAVMTPDGRYVAFDSTASNLVPGDTNRIRDVFIRDLQTGVTALASTGLLPNSFYFSRTSSESPQITPDGRYVAFLSKGVTNGSVSVGDIYVRDLVGQTTVWASTNALPVVKFVTGASYSYAISYNQTISADGRFVAYEASPSPYLSSRVILRYSLQTGATDIVTTNAAGIIRGSESFDHSLVMTPDGRFIAFVGNTNVSGAATCVYLWDAQTGTAALASGDLNNAVPPGSSCYVPTLDPLGRFVAFLTSANLTTNSLHAGDHVYLRDMQTGVTRLLDAGVDGVGSGVSPGTIPSLSDDGRFVAFESPDGNLVPNDNNRANDVFVRDLTPDTVELISSRNPNLPSRTPAGPSILSTLSVSANGRNVAFASEADNLVANDTNGCRDVFVRDLLTASNLLVSIATNGVTAGDGVSTDSAISADGRYVAFTSSADNLVAGDTNKTQDVFVRDLQAGTTMLVSVSTNGIDPGDGPSSSPVISADGKFVLFRSRARTLAAGLFSGSTENLFWRDLQSGTTYALSTAGVSPAAMTPDGCFVAFGASSVSGLYVWDAQTGTIIFTNATSGGVTSVAISPDGTRLVYSSGSPAMLYALDRSANTNWVVGLLASIFHTGLQFSGDGRFLAYSTAAAQVTGDVNGITDVYLYDFQNGTNILISKSFASLGGANDVSDSPDISADGRFVAYRSFASDIVPGDSNGVPDIFLYDRSSGTTILVSLNTAENSTADNRSLTPVFSSDGQTLLLQSWASDMTGFDLNHNSDLFALNLSVSPITDFDGDGMDDGWEIQHFATLDRDGSGDFDSDGASDLFEFITGTDPKDPLSLFRGQIILSSAGSTISWPATPGKAYRVEFKNILDDADWQILDGNIGLIGPLGFVSDPMPLVGQRFYRIVSF